MSRAQAMSPFPEKFDGSPEGPVRPGLCPGVWSLSLGVGGTTADSLGEGGQARPMSQSQRLSKAGACLPGRCLSPGRELTLTDP